MTAILCAAVVVALGLLRLQRLAFPAPPPLAQQAMRWEQARLRASRRAHEDSTVGERTWSTRLAEWVAENLRTRRPETIVTYECDLAITGQPVEEWLARLLVLFLIGLAGPVMLVVLGTALGLHIPLLVAPVLGVLIGAVAVIATVAELRENAGKKRDELCDALSDFLDLVVMSMEGGRSHADALPTVAQIGNGWAWHTLSDTIDNARSNVLTPWEALGDLGERLGVVELIDLRASLNLAQDEGSSVRSTLIARAQSMRDARLAESQARANKSTEAMRNTLVLMALLTAVYVIAARILFLFTA